MDLELEASFNHTFGKSGILNESLPSFVRCPSVLDFPSPGCIPHHYHCTSSW